MDWAALLGTIAIILGCFLLVIPLMVIQWQGRQRDAEVARMVYVFEQALLSVKAGSAIEKVQADTTRKAADLQLAMLEDALVKERAQAARQESDFNPEPKWVSGVDKDGKPVNVNLADGWEVVE